MWGWGKDSLGGCRRGFLGWDMLGEGIPEEVMFGSGVGRGRKGYDPALRPAGELVLV